MHKTYKLNQNSFAFFACIISLNSYKTRINLPILYISYNIMLIGLNMKRKKGWVWTVSIFARQSFGVPGTFYRDTNKS